MSVVVSTTCYPHIKERYRIIVIRNPSVTCDREITIFTCLKECIPLLIVQCNCYAKFLLPHVLKCFSNSFVSIVCVVQVLYNRESFTVRVTSLCKELSGFLAVCFISIFCRIIVISANFTEVRSFLSIRDTAWYISTSFNLSGLSYFFNNVVTVNSKCECLTYFRIIERSFLCLEAYIICSKVIYDLHITGSDQIRKFCLRSLLNVIKLAGFETGKHSICIIHQFECKSIRSKVCIIIVILIFCHYNL